MGNSFLFEQGKLAHRAGMVQSIPPINRLLIQYPTPLQDIVIEVITLREHYIVQAFLSVTQNQPIWVDDENQDKWHTRVQYDMQTLMDSGTLMVQEFVEVSPQMKVIVCLDVDYLTSDDDNTAVSRLLETGLSPKVTYFNKPRTFTSEDAETTRIRP